MTALSEACTDLAAWMPVVGVLVAEPDITGSSEGHAQPGSKPPWNPQAANVYYDLHALVRHAEALLVLDVAGTIRVRSGSDTGTHSALDAIPKLAEAADTQLAGDLGRQLARMLARVLQLPAIDLEDTPRRPEAPCPRCQRKMLRYYEREFLLTGELACIGCLRKAVLTIGVVPAEPWLTWDDGEITIAPSELEGTAA